MKLEVITKGLEDLLFELHYNPKTLDFYHREWIKINDFLLDEYGDTEFNIDRGLLFLEKHYNFIASALENKLTQNRVQLLRVINMLNDYSLYGVISNRYYNNKNPLVLIPQHQQVHEQYLNSLIESEMSNSTIDHYGKISKYFLDYLNQMKVYSLCDLSLDMVYNYIGTFSGLSFKTIEQRICGIRSFLRFLYRENFLICDYSAKIHMPNISKTAKVPSHWKENELKEMLSVIDRNSPIGKRDYAMILLATVLGLRVGDIKNLRFGNIDWESKKISIIQHKTKKPLTLPLPDVVGWAIIDYIKNGRPKYYETDIIFLKHMPPFDPIPESDHLVYIIKKYCAKAGIDGRKNKKIGFHSLRHSAGSMLLDVETPLPVITNILGHSSSDVTAVYLKTDLIKLKECILSMEGIDYE